MNSTYKIIMIYIQIWDIITHAYNISYLLAGTIGKENGNGCLLQHNFSNEAMRHHSMTILRQINFSYDVWMMQYGMEEGGDMIWV